MGLALCPECGARISSKARMCPQCGYFADDPALPLSEQALGEIVPVEYEITAWVPEDDTDAPLNRTAKGLIARFFSNWEIFRKAVPELALSVQRILEKPQTEYRAKLTSELRKLMGEGRLRFKVDKQGELMAVLQDGKNVIRKQVRLEEIHFTPDVKQAVDSLTMTAYLGQILREIQSLHDSINELHIEIQDDRLALADAARDQFLQAQVIPDSKLRATAVLNAISAATEAKHRLMRHYTRSSALVLNNSGQNVLQMFLSRTKGKELDEKASDALNDLAQIAVSVQVECAGWSALGAYPSIEKSLMEFRRFIEQQHLNDPDTLLLLNENSDRNLKQVVSGFTDITRRITAYADGPEPLTIESSETMSSEGAIDDEAESLPEENL
ncbi:zinc ribbon domain-containing protein [Bifidobacterium pullorum]|uniref:zinc ribbon domain-containing protein n=1 Tax=Bifidobacterium pullorum TaxID=78448 RepID=UPI00052970AD|nr:zinc ribbon domain-containing protein [Bifidobacterium pullorum]